MRKRPETHSHPKSGTPKATRFHQVGRYKQVLIESFRAGSLINASTTMRRLRIALAGILFAGSIVLLIASDIWGEPTGDFIQSPPFLLLVLSGFCFFYAIGLLLMGFVRGLTAPALAALTAYSLYTVIHLQTTLTGRSLILRLSTILLAAFLYGLILYFFISGLRKRHDLFNWIYRRDNQMIGVDIALKDLLPIHEYTELISATFQIERIPDEEDQQNRVIRLTEWYHHCLAAQQMLPCGFIYETATGDLTLYAYSCASLAVKHAAYCQRILSRRFSDADIRRQPDETWNTYRTLLYPEPVILHDIINEQQLQMLEDEGVDLQDQHQILLEIRLPDHEKLEAARKTLETAGYLVETDEYCGAHEPGDQLESVVTKDLAEADGQDDSFFLLINLTTRLGLERLNTITRNLIKLIEPSGGDLFGWELIDQEADIYETEADEDEPEIPEIYEIDSFEEFDETEESKKTKKIRNLKRSEKSAADLNRRPESAPSKKKKRNQDRSK